MYNVWQSVKVINAAHPRVNTAGTVFSTNATAHPDEVVVKFDLDGTEEAVKLADLQGL